MRSWFESHKDGNVSAAKSCVFPEQDGERKGDQSLLVLQGSHPLPQAGPITSS